MTPQSEFLVLAPVRPEALKPLRALLAGMNAAPGHADPANRLVPFGAFPTLHVARFVVLEDETLADNAAFGIAPFDAPVYLAFLGDCDGPAATLLDELVRAAGAGLSRIFSHCEGISTGSDLRAWMQPAWFRRRPTTSTGLAELSCRSGRNRPCTRRWRRPSPAPGRTG